MELYRFHLVVKVQLESRLLMQKAFLLINSSYEISQVTGNEQIQVSSDCKIRITPIKGRDSLSDGALCYVRLTAKGHRVLDSKSRSGIHKPSLVRTEAWGKSLREIRPGKWSHITVLGPMWKPPKSPPEVRAGHTDLAKRYFQVWTLSKKKEQLLCTPDCDSGERSPKTDFWGCWRLWPSIQNSGTMTVSTYTYLRQKEREGSWSKSQASPESKYRCGSAELSLNSTGPAVTWGHPYGALFLQVCRKWGFKGTTLFSFFFNFIGERWRSVFL